MVTSFLKNTEILKYKILAKLVKADLDHISIFFYLMTEIALTWQNRNEEFSFHTVSLTDLFWLGIWERPHNDIHIDLYEKSQTFCSILDFNSKVYKLYCISVIRNDDNPLRKFWFI